MIKKGHCVQVEFDVIFVVVHSDTFYKWTKTKEDVIFFKASYNEGVSNKLMTLLHINRFSSES